MKIEVGRHYRMRNGQTAFIKQSIQSKSRSGAIGTIIFGTVEESGNLCMWGPDGRRSPDQDGDHPDDLIAPIGDKGE